MQHSALLPLYGMKEYSMIIGAYFDGDNDDKLKMLQHGGYYDMLRGWITMAGVRRLTGRIPKLLLGSD